MTTSVIGIVGLGLQAVGLVGGLSANKKANKAIKSQNAARERAAQVEERRQALQRRRERTRLITQARSQRANVIASAVQRGGVQRLSGSSIRGAVNLTQQRLNTALGTQSAFAAAGSEATQASREFAAAGGQLSEAQRQGGIFSGISTFGGSLINAADSKAFKTIFS